MGGGGGGGGLLWFMFLLNYHHKHRVNPCKHTYRQRKQMFLLVNQKKANLELSGADLASGPRPHPDFEDKQQPFCFGLVCNRSPLSLLPH